MRDTDVGRVDVGPIDGVGVARGSINSWGFDPAGLLRLSDQHAAAYRGATPFPHVVLDGMLPASLLDDVSASFPPPGADVWIRHNDPMQRKLQWADPAVLPAPAAHLIGLLQGAAFIEFLEELTGITGLMGDPHLHHGGLHQIEPGGYLKIHADDLSQPRLALVRRVNVIVYLNRDWETSWGGDLELWNAAMSRCGRRIAPSFNRTVVLDVTADSNHGHPDPMSAPPGVLRRSVALYYYTSPEHSPDEWAARQDNAPKARPNEVIRLGSGARSPSRLLQELCPPIVSRWARRWRH